MKVNYPETILKQASGSTKSEQYLVNLCKQSFLSMWSFANIYRDQGRKKPHGDGKEVCDLLVVFGNDLIIFSDKNCVFPEGPNLNLNWSRWYRKAILQSADQIFGAEKWLRYHQNRIYLDKDCKTKFPIKLPDESEVRFHRIVVSHGISAHCKKNLGGSGSLIINTLLQGLDHTELDRCLPFNIGTISPEKGFVHVLDDTSLKILLTTLDTITDFVDYLKAKEKLFSGNFQIIAAGEEELIAAYLSKVDINDKHDFPSPEPGSTMMVFQEGNWDRFRNSKERLNQINADKISYLWDQLIETSVGHLFGGTSQFLSNINIQDQEKGLRLLAKESRMHRRILSEALFEVIHRTKRNQRATRTIQPIKDGSPCYVYLVLDRQNIVDEDRYRTFRRELLFQYCIITKLQFPKATTMIGIATEPGVSDARSEDIVVVDTTKWTEEDQLKAIDLENKLKADGLRAEGKWSQQLIYEFPETKSFPKSENKNLKGKDRNKPCLCGSGKKFKHCCANL